jgi:TolB-like protein
MAEAMFGPFVFDRERMALWREGRPVAIGGRAAALLAALLDADGAAVSKSALLEAAWPGKVVEEGNLTAQIRALRRALGLGRGGTDWIATVERVGYRLLRPEAAPRARTGGRPLVAVLPFANMSADPEQDHFADGIVDDIITALSRFKSFAVVARNSSFVYKGRAVDVREIAKDLGVRYVLEGSVQRAGERVRVNTQLIDAASAAHLWAEHFDSRLEDIFDLEDRITESVIGLIEPQIRKAEIERARRKRTESLDAWDLFMQALPMVYSMNVPSYTEAIGLLRRAVAQDPAFAQALVLAAWAHEKRFTFGGTAPPGVDDRQTCLALADQALEADADDPIVLVLVGYFRILFRHDYTGMALCERALALNPNNLLVLNIAGIAHLFGGDLDESLFCHVRALELSPGAPDNYVSLHGVAAAHYMAGRFEEAIAWAERSIELNKGHIYNYLFIACSNAQLDRPAEAQTALRSALALWPDLTIALEMEGTSMRFPERDALWVDGLRKAGMPEA